MSVLLRGGRRDVGAIEAPGALVMTETVGEGVEDDIFEVITGDKLPSPILTAASNGKTLSYQAVRGTSPRDEDGGSAGSQESRWTMRDSKERIAATSRTRRRFILPTVPMSGCWTSAKE